MSSKNTKEALLYNILLLISIVIIFILGYNLGFLNQVKEVQLVMQTIILASIVCYAFADRKSTKKYFQLMYLILFLGIVMRIGYMLYTGAYVRSHDAGKLGLDQYGHFSYIHRIYMTGKLPNTNRGQLYHPPLFHILSVMMMKVVRLFTKDYEISRLIEAAKIISCFASCATLRITYLICKELDLEYKFSCIVTAFIAFLPNMYLLSGRINNDSLVIYFIFVIILYTIRWSKTRSYKNTIILALAFGLGISTKISCGIFAVFTGTIMLIVLIKEIHDGHVFSILKKLVCFGVISFPLGLWFPIRNHTLFKQPFNYVLRIPLESDLFCGDKGIVKRFIHIPINTMFDNLYNRPKEDYNIHIYTIKGALFGEFSFDIADIIPIALLIIYFVILFIAIIGMVYAIIQGIKSIIDKTIKDKSIHDIFMYFGAPSIWGIMMVSYIVFNIKYPFGCTMDYRYIVPTALVNAIMFGYCYHIVESEITKTSNLLYMRLGRVFIAFVKILIILFSILSLVMFCNINK